MRAPVTLIPAERQRLWGWPAVLNFALGGLGAGVYLVAVAGARLGATPAVTTAAWLGPLLVLAGFAAVATEAGRPGRGPRVLARLATSWMSRELWLGGAFVALAGLELLAPGPGARALAAGAALGLAGAQGFIVRRARGVAAWDVAIVPTLFVVSSLVSGAGLALVLETLAGRPAGRGALGTAMALLAVGVVVWLAYVAWSEEPAFAESTAGLRHGAGATTIVGVGYVLPLALAGIALVAPGLATAATVLAGLAMIAGQVHAKAALILRCGHLRPVTLATLRLSRRLT